MNDAEKAQLIREVQQRPAIWKAKLPHRAGFGRQAAFNQVASTMSEGGRRFTADMIKEAWKNMTDTFELMAKREERAIAAGFPRPVSPWPFYTMMEFYRNEMLRINRSNPTTSSSKGHSNKAEVSGSKENDTVCSAYGSVDGSVPQPGARGVKNEGVDGFQNNASRIAFAGVTENISTVERTKSETVEEPAVKFPTEIPKSRRDSLRRRPKKNGLFNDTDYVLEHPQNKVKKMSSSETSSSSDAPS